MYFKIKYHILNIISLIGYSLLPTTAKAQIQLPNELKPNYIPDVEGATAEDKINAVAGNLIITVLQVAGGIAVILIIVTAFNYVLARGEEEKISQAKTTMGWIIGGLLLIATSYAIIRFVIKLTLITEEANL